MDVQELCGPGETWWGVRGEMRDNFNHSNTPISYAEHFQNSRFVESILDVYWEIPPVAGPSLAMFSKQDMILLVHLVLSWKMAVMACSSGLV